MAKNRADTRGGEDEQLRRLLRKPSCRESQGETSRAAEGPRFRSPASHVPAAGALSCCPALPASRGDCREGARRAQPVPKLPWAEMYPAAASRSLSAGPRSRDAPLVPKAMGHALPVRETLYGAGFPSKVWGRRMLEMGVGSRRQACPKGWGSSGTWDVCVQSPAAARLFNPSLHKLKSRSTKSKADRGFGKVTSRSQKAEIFLLWRAINTQAGGY